MQSEKIQKEQRAIITQIKKYVPLMAPFFELPDTLQKYSENLQNFEIHKVHRTRQKMVKEIINRKVRQLFGVKAISNLQINLSEKLALNITDHHSVLNHPLLIGDNVVSSVKKFFQPQRPDATIVISSGDVPPNNYFTKNGFQLHGKRVPLFSVSEREYTSYYLPKREFNFVQRLKTSGRWHEFNTGEQQFLINEQACISSLDFSRCQNYLDQISIIVQHTWPLLFEEKLRPTLPQLIYISQEELVTECLINLLHQDTFISASLFDPVFRERVLNNFRGIIVTWRENEGKGTHFFWRKYPGQPRSLRMYLEHGVLVPQDPRFKDSVIPLDRETIIGLLKKGEIYPSLFLIFSVLCFYAGVKPLTGYGSRVYLEYFKRAWIKTLMGSDFENELDALNMVDPSSFIAGFALFFKRIDGKVKTLYAYDAIFEGGMTEQYLQKIFSMKFNDLISVAAADMYDYYAQKYVPTHEKIVPKISFDDLAELAFPWL